VETTSFKFGRFVPLLRDASQKRAITFALVISHFYEESSRSRDAITDYVRRRYTASFVR